jgi:glycosyltransferase involved in cell wall biosynthesis
MQTSLKWDIELLQGYRHMFLRNWGAATAIRASSIRSDPGHRARQLRRDPLLPRLGNDRRSSAWRRAASRTRRSSCTATAVSAAGGLVAREAAGDVPSRRVRAGEPLSSLGKLNAEYYRHYGGDPRRFFLLPWAIDNERFASASRFAPGEREAMRVAMVGIAPEQVAFVFSAKLVARKDPMTLLHAVARMQHRDRAAVVFLGHGELREALDSFAREHRLNVTFAGFVNQADLPKHYAICDVFVLPSTYEPRGAVINEAMACGLPVVVTDRCGSLGDIVQENDNAFVYPASDADALARALDALMNDALRAKMGRRSREIIATWDYARGVEGVKERCDDDHDRHPDVQPRRDPRRDDRASARVDAARRCDPHRRSDETTAHGNRAAFAGVER